VSRLTEPVPGAYKFAPAGPEWPQRGTQNANDGTADAGPLPASAVTV